jgi:hypothetical protein
MHVLVAAFPMNATIQLFEFSTVRAPYVTVVLVAPDLMMIDRPVTPQPVLATPSVSTTEPE